MAYTPTPILVVSSSVYGEGIGLAFDALRLGALEVIKKPEVRDWAELERIGREVIGKVKILARVRVITHISGRQPREDHTVPVRRGEGRAKRELVTIGSSTGGPSALLEVLGALPAGFGAPIVIVQHIARGFVPGLVEWLDAACALRVAEAAAGLALEPGVAYVAPSGHDVAFSDGSLGLREPGLGQLYAPSADALFESAAEIYGQRAIGVIMTGMGADGATGLRSMRDAGATTIAQDEATCTVYGMPKSAIESGAVARVLPLGEIAGVLEQLVAE
jgi:two-component system chemotaxis response regulator CheB